MLRLVWYSDGAVKANTMASKCIFAHDSASARATAKYPSGGGQNLYATTAKNPVNWTEVVKAWWSEVNSFTFGVDRNNFTEVGHYTQVVWGTTGEIGCARSICASQQIYTCNYYPAGNFPPYYVPYRNSPIQSCSGCLANASCVATGPFAGKLLQTCTLFCSNKYSNCPSLAQQGFCSQFLNDCAQSCRSECKSEAANTTGTITRKATTKARKSSSKPKKINTTCSTTSK